MSTIAGIFYTDSRSINRKIILEMLDRSINRGPDRSSIWVEDEIGLGNGLLITTPESENENQPLVSLCSNYVITADARLDNRAELLNYLGLNTKPEYQITDTELILNTYVKLREKCIEKLVGDFSFAIWDKKDNKLFCARDHFGIKPFYYFYDGLTFIFGSQINQIFVDKNVKIQPNEPMIAEYLNGYIESKEETLYKNVFRLPPANYLIISKDRIYKNKYWDIEPSNIIQYKTDLEYSEHFLSIFKSSVLNCMRSNNNVGLYLSGGLDSSSVFGLVQSLHLNSPEMENFSLIFPGMQCDESNYINDVVNMWDKDAHKIIPELSDYSWSTEDIRNHMDFPDYPNGSMMKPLMKLARDMDIRVMLTGLGGDEWFTGRTTYLADVLRNMDFKLLQNELKYLYSNYDFKITFNTVLNHMIRPLIPHQIKQIIRTSLNKLKGKQNFAEWINKEFAEKVDLKDRLKSDINDNQFKIASQKQLYNILHNSSRINNLEAEERLSSSFGLEERHPFYNKNIIEFSFSLPEHQRIQRFLTKHILRSSMKDCLPVSVVNRADKAHFNNIVYQALASNDVFETLKNLKIASIGWVNKDTVINNYKIMVKLYNHKDYRYYKYIFPLCSVYGMELWYHNIIE